MRELLVPCALSGQPGVRNVTALTSVCRVLLDYESLVQLEKRVSAGEPKELAPSISTEDLVHILEECEISTQDDFITGLRRWQSKQKERA